MGTIKQGILGGFSGKVGSVIGSSWKGIACMRGRAQSVSNPQTEPQLAQRQKFSLVMAFLQTLSEFLKVGFKNYAKHMSGINAAMGYNLANAITGAYPNFAIDYPNALVSRGSLPAALNQAAASTVAGTVNFTWVNNSGETGASAVDKTLLVVYNPAKHQAVTLSQLADRADGTQTVTVPASFTGDLVHCYIGFITANGFELSSSRYAGAVTVA
jgi:hypothetical protein